MWRDHQDAKKELAVKERELKAAQGRLDRNRDPGSAAQLTRELADAKLRFVDSQKREIGTQEAWNEERDRNEPDLIRKLRDRLGQNKSVKQLFDPWYMDANTADNIPPVPNEQREENRNERTHNNHLHITVREPKIL